MRSERTRGRRGWRKRRSRRRRTRIERTRGRRGRRRRSRRRSWTRIKKRRRNPWRHIVVTVDGPAGPRGVKENLPPG